MPATGPQGAGTLPELVGDGDDLVADRGDVLVDGGDGGPVDLPSCTGPDTGGAAVGGDS